MSFWPSGPESYPQAEAHSLPVEEKKTQAKQLEKEAKDLSRQGGNTAKPQLSHSQPPQ